MNLAESKQGGSPKSAPHETSVREKVRIRFRKDGPLRFISHNDLMRCWDRLVRRSGLPLSFSQGFNPKPRLSSPLALGVGTIGCEEILELELTESLDPQRVQQLLEANTVEGLSILSVTLHPSKEQTRVDSLEYTFPVPDGCSAATLEQRAAQILAADHWPVRRTHPKKPDREVDLRPYLLGLKVTDQQVWFHVGVVNGGTARAEELLGLLGLDQHHPRVVLTRSRVHLA
jgi:radical SAM-linked protein